MLELTERSDTRDKPYKCSCGSAFTRRDLLTRHWRIAQHDGEASTIASTSSSEPRRDTQQHDATHTHHVAVNELINNSRSELDGSHLLHQPRMEYPTPNLQHDHVPLINQGQQNRGRFG